MTLHSESEFLRLEHTHDITLLGDNVLYGRRDVLRFPQPSSASVACPPLPIRLIQTRPIQTAAGVSLEIIHDTLRLSLRFHHCMYVIASHVGSQQCPAAMPAHLLNGFSYRVATDRVHVICRLIHALLLPRGTRRIFFQNRSSRHIVRGIDGAGTVAMQVAAIAGKGDQVSHGMATQF